MLGIEIACPWGGYKNVKRYTYLYCITFVILQVFMFIPGDGRNDSPGHSAQYCTYTLMQEMNSDILAIVSVDKREANLKSTNMEVMGLRKALLFLQERGLTVAEVVTDAHPQIPPLLSKYLPEKETRFTFGHGSLVNVLLRL